MNVYLKYSLKEISANVILSFLFHQNDIEKHMENNNNNNTYIEQLI